MRDKNMLAILLAPLLLHASIALAQPHYRLTPVRPFYGPAGMNDLGQIVGGTFDFDNNGLPQGAVWTPGADPSTTLLGSPYDTANGINNAGQVTGTHRYAPNVDRAVVFSEGRFQDLGTLGGRSSTGYAINERGQVAGFSAIASGVQHAFLYADGRMQDLGALAGGWSYAYAINDKGQVAGGATVARGHEAPPHAFLYSAGSMTDLSRFAAEEGIAYGINNLEQVVGAYRIGNSDYRGFLYEDGVTTTLPTLGGVFSVAFSINDKGDIAGYSAIASGEHHAFIYTDGKMIDLNTLLDTQEGWTVSMVNAINENGDLAGMACRPHPDAAGAFDCASVLMTPVPEPPGPALWTCAALFGWALHAHRARRRRRQAWATHNDRKPPWTSHSTHSSCTSSTAPGI